MADTKEKGSASRKTAFIRLPKKHGEDAKFVGIDGVSYLVKRGIDVEVPIAVYNELMRAEAAETRAEEQAEAMAANE